MSELLGSKKYRLGRGRRKNNVEDKKSDSISKSTIETCKSRLRSYELAEMKFQMARRIKELRSANGITQTQLSKKMETSQARIAALENAGNTTLDSLFRALGGVGEGFRQDVRFAQIGLSNVKGARRGIGVSL